MNIVFILLPLSIALGALFAAAYAWSARTGQFDDLHTPSIRMLAEEELKKGD